MNLYRKMSRARETAQRVRVLAANAGYLTYLRNPKYQELDCHDD